MDTLQNLSAQTVLKVLPKECLDLLKDQWLTKETIYPLRSFEPIQQIEGGYLYFVIRVNSIFDRTSYHPLGISHHYPSLCCESLYRDSFKQIDNRLSFFSVWPDEYRFQCEKEKTIIATKPSTSSFRVYILPSSPFLQTVYLDREELDELDLQTASLVTTFLVDKPQGIQDYYSLWTMDRSMIEDEERRIRIWQDLGSPHAQVTLFGLV